MAKRKGKPDRKPPGRRGRSRPTPADLPEIPDRRAMEELMQRLMAGESGGDPDTPLGKAQQVMYQAFRTPDPDERANLARKALEISPDCADAYAVLAGLVRTRKEALALYEQGVAAGERALGPQTFREGAGHFWGILDTRPYMRAREGLAHALWGLTRRDEAVGHLQDMLRLNPGDNQGLRYTLAAWLLTLDRDEDLARLLEQYPDEGSATWAYTRALLAFRRQGDTPEARRLLKDAKKRNKHVPAYLLGHKPMPPDRPGYYSPGEVTEAVMYAGDFMGAWKATPGAMAWLRGAEPPPRKKRAAAPPAEGPSPLVKERLRKLPQEDDVWQADFRQLPLWFESGRERKRPWIVLVASRSTDLMLAHVVEEDQPSAEVLWDRLAQAMRRPLAGEPHRPTELQLRAGDAGRALQPHVEELGIDCVLTDELSPWDAKYESLRRHLTADAPPGLLDTPGVHPDEVARFCQAAAEFYRRAPWRSLGYEETIKVECPRFATSPWYAVTMGQMGMTFGLSLYDDLSILTRMRQGDTSDEENAWQTVALTVTYGDATEIPPADLEAVERYGWEVAGPDAYPHLFRKERGMTTRPPLAWEVELMEGCLRAVPDFVARHRPDRPARETVTVPAGPRELTLTLSWVQEDGG
jgi:tetratricopeptide (TPR) repeat protein